ncbi:MULTISPECIES: hypothetical protein [unclassified Haladaptatus]|uniref:DUF7089 family protein n=1 Tax=unclassified Haladaptatus TaxID=2622732 RepID=UPI0023E7983A|nr:MULTISPECIES: hypothetical protein [unclassified Haladaptatus]
MFDARDLSEALAAVRDEHAPGAIVLDTETDFETLPPDQAESLGLLVDSLSPTSYPAEWLPEDAPQLLTQYASNTFTIGMPGDGSVVWTRQTTPPLVFVKARTQGSPKAFIDFLIAEAFVELGTGEPEHFLPFFGDAYRDLDDALALGPVDTYQIAAALYDAYLGLQTRDVFASWQDTHPDLFDAWQDAGVRMEPRLSNLTRDVALGKTDFAAATEYACSAVKHGLELPAPFGALDTQAYREHGAPYAVKWAEKTFERLREA